MQEIVRLLEQNMVYIILGLLGISLVFFILIIALFIKNKKLKKRYNEFMRGSEADIEDLLRVSIKQTQEVQDSYKYIRESIGELQTQIKDCVQKVGVVRYCAVSGTGAELSFAVALLDDGDNGVVVNGIYTREGSYTYAKEIIKGESKHLLSDEEKEAIVQASRHK